MPPKTTRTAKYILASASLLDAYTDFILSRQAILCSPQTMRWYGFTAGRFCKWLEAQGITDPAEVTARYVRAYLAELAPSLADSTLHGHARAVKTLLRFWHDEGYTGAIKFDMPKVSEKRLPVLDAEELKAVIGACDTRDKALVMFLADSGVRRSELLSLKWDDLDFTTGAVRVLHGKGGKYRVVFCGAKTGRAQLKYRRTSTGDRVFPLTKAGIQSLFMRLSKRTGIHVTPHCLRRTFATLALRGGMSIAHVSALLKVSSVLPCFLPPVGPNPNIDFGPVFGGQVILIVIPCCL